MGETDLVPPFDLSGRSKSCCGQTPPLGKLEQVVGGAHDRPFAAHFGEAAQQELAESAGLFDLPKHRFGQLLAPPVRARVPAGLDLRPHGFDTG